MRVFSEWCGDQTRELVDKTDKREDVLRRVVVVVQLSEEISLRKGVSKSQTPEGTGDTYSSAYADVHRVGGDGGRNLDVCGQLAKHVDKKTRPGVIEGGPELGGRRCDIERVVDGVGCARRRAFQLGRHGREEKDCLRGREVQRLK